MPPPYLRVPRPQPLNQQVVPLLAPLLLPLRKRVVPPLNHRVAKRRRPPVVVFPRQRNLLPQLLNPNQRRLQPHRLPQNVLNDPPLVSRLLPTPCPPKIVTPSDFCPITKSPTEPPNRPAQFAYPPLHAVKQNAEPRPLRHGGLAGFGARRHPHSPLDAGALNAHDHHPLHHHHQLFFVRVPEPLLI